MKKLFAAFMPCLFFFTATAQQSLVLQADQGKVTINRHIYGHFAEHLGNCIYGGFYVGDSNRTIPHTAGVRNDIIAALRKMKIPNLRWPGGCFADTYHWKDGVGPKGSRPSIVNRWWGGVTEDNSFGTHEFLNMCVQLGAEPYLSGNVGSGTVQELADWMQYVNGAPGGSPMAKLRAANGQLDPWKVRYWGVGNEAWGCGGNMKADYYANIYRQYATYMSDWGNTGKMFRIASGASDDDYQWTEVLMRDIPHNLLDGVALHHYSIISWSNKGSATNFSEGQYMEIMKSALRMDEMITRHATIMDKYDPLKKIAMVVDEWGGWYDVEPGTNPGFLFQQNTIRDAMVAGVTLNIFNNHAERVRMANLAQTVNVLQAVVLTKEEKLVLTPTYHVMEMYSVHQDATMLPLQVTGKDYVLGKDKLPALSASASVDKLGVTHISLVNIDPNQSQDISIDIRGKKFKQVDGRILTSAKLQDYNSFETPNRISPTAFSGAKLSDQTLQVKLPPHSVVVLNLQ